MELYSKRLDKNIELDGVLTETGEALISSWALIQFLMFDEDVKKQGVHLEDIKLLYANETSAIYSVTIRDTEGACWTSIGEANAENLESTISKKYPHTMAMKRAIDRAIIEFFSLNDGNGKRLYSDNEITKGCDILNDAVNGNYDVPVNDIIIDEIPIPEGYEELTVANPSTELTKTEEKEKEELLDYKVQGGTNKNKSIKVLKETNMSFLNYIMGLEPSKIKNEGQIELYHKLKRLKELGGI